MRLSNRHSVRGASARRRVKPAWASAVGRDDYGDWAEISVGKARQRLRLIRPGKFMMGSPESEAGRFKCEGPQHEVEIRQPFWLFDTACTQALWKAVMGTNPSEFKGKDRPVEQVSWDDAQEFIAKINDRILGLNLSLPSEAQWEYACRAGTQGMSYAGDFEILGADNPPGLDAIAWYGENCGEDFDLKDGAGGSGTRPVKLKQANDFGLYDMLGNVGEWCADAWHETYDGAPCDGSVWESEDRAADRVVRGGSFCLPAMLIRSALRLGAEPDDWSVAGFRCARVQDGAEPAPAQRIQRSGVERSAASPSGGATRDANEQGVEISPKGAPRVLRGAGMRWPVKPAWASAVGRDDYGDWADISVGKARQRLRWIAPTEENEPFLMGSPEGEAGQDYDEEQQHEVTIKKGYWLFDTPCTQALWTAVMGKNPSRFKSADRPVEMVSWYDAQDFIAKINERVPGLNLSLPSEAQWEYACRAGTQGMSYAGDFEILGDRKAPGVDAIAWYSGNSGHEFDLKEGEDSSDWPEKQYNHKKAGTRRVKLKRANDFGLYDMLGNVWEWCADAWHWTYDGAPDDGSVWESEDKEPLRVVRGGSWLALALHIRSASRAWDYPAERFEAGGFRCARVQE